jgi:hypothetical protein
LPPPICDIYAQDCPEGLACAPYPRPWGPFDFRCLQPGLKQVTETCGGGEGSCAAGLICVRVGEEALATCQEICTTDEQCTQPGNTCRGLSSRFEVRFCR